MSSNISRATVEKVFESLLGKALDKVMEKEVAQKKNDF
jgi:hypothetical protein